MKMGIVLIIVGVVIAAAGIGMVANDKQPSKQKIETVSEAPKQQPTQPRSVREDAPQKAAEPTANKQEAREQEAKETPQKSSKEKGNEFEAFLADVFKKSGVVIKEWNQGTVTANGAMGENALKPDFYLEQNGDKSPFTYWAEAKWRRKIGDSNFTLREDQLQRYKTHQGKTRRKVVIILGVGGEPGSPTAIFMIPVDSLTNAGLSFEDLKPFRVTSHADGLTEHIRLWFVNEVFKRK